jgi:hypothetical protein
VSFAAHHRLFRLVLPTLLVALLACVWATDQPSPSYPNGRFPVILLELVLLRGLVAVLAYLWRMARGHRGGPSPNRGPV